MLFVAFIAEIIGPDNSGVHQLMYLSALPLLFLAGVSGGNNVALLLFVMELWKLSSSPSSWLCEHGIDLMLIIFRLLTSSSVRSSILTIPHENKPVVFFFSAASVSSSLSDMVAASESIRIW